MSDYKPASPRRWWWTHYWLTATSSVCARPTTKEAIDYRADIDGSHALSILGSGAQTATIANCAGPEWYAA